MCTVCFDSDKLNLTQLTIAAQNQSFQPFLHGKLEVKCEIGYPVTIYFDFVRKSVF